MNFPRITLALCAAAAVIGPLWGQDAQEIINATAKVYAEAQTYSAQVDSRTLQLVFAPAQAGEAPRYDVTGTQYRRIQLKVRRPGDYWLAAQSVHEGAPNMMDARMGMMGGVNSWSVLARVDGGMGKRGFYQGTKFLVQDMQAEPFNAMIAARMGPRANEDVVLRHFQVQPSSPGTLALGLLDPEVIGRESRNGRQVLRVVAKTSGGNPIMLWIDQTSFVIVRSIVQRTGVPAGTAFGSAAAAVGAAGRQVSVVETFYTNQQLRPAFTGADFAIVPPATPEHLAPEQMGFVAIADLVKLAEIGPAADKGGLADAPATPPATPAVPPVVPASAGSTSTDGQVLSYEQMSGIVLIEGDGGTATGFMTKIRDVDFIVTNLHVLEGNKKLSLKTLRGEEIPMLGIFGAVGSDIAIIRISHGQGELKLAADVFASSKIGDKVVVVGNRLGGGVATQTAGSIVGVGPTRVEVNANFEPGNSGSPIFNLSTNEVVGVATYAETRRMEVEDRPASSANSSEAGGKVEKRWFGYRLDSVAKWEAIDLAKWNAQGDRIDKFRETSEALHAVIRFDFKTACLHPRLSTTLDAFETKYRASSGNSIAAANEVKDMFRVIRTISEDGVRELTSGDYYDYYRTSLYWKTSIPAQIEYRKAIIEVLKKLEANSSLYVSRMRGGS